MLKNLWKHILIKLIKYTHEKQNENIQIRPSKG